MIVKMLRRFTTFVNKPFQNAYDAGWNNAIARMKEGRVVFEHEDQAWIDKPATIKAWRDSAIYSFVGYSNSRFNFWAVPANQAEYQRYATIFPEIAALPHDPDLTKPLRTR